MATTLAITLSLDRYEREALKVLCLECGAAPDEWCHIRRTGRPAIGLHVNRFDTATSQNRQED